MHTMYLPAALRGQKTARDPLELELWKFSVAMWVLGTKPGSFARAVGVLLTTETFSSPRDKLFLSFRCTVVRGLSEWRRSKGGYLTSSETQGWPQIPQLFPPEVLGATLVSSTPW